MYTNILRQIKITLKDDFDVKYRKIKCKEGIIYLIFIDNLCDKTFISEYIVAPLVNMKELNGDVATVKEEVLYASFVGDIENAEEALSHVLSGDVLILFDFMKSAIYCDAKQYAKRAIEKPEFDPVLKGPKESFNEHLSDNISLIRKRMINSDLKIENFQVGKESNTLVALIYMNEAAPKKLVEFVRQKILDMDDDLILGTNYIEETLSSTNTTLDTIGYTEKPDVVVSKLFEGRIAIVANGTPFVSTAPFFFIENFHSADDYYTNKFFSNYLRILRFTAFFVTLLLPGFYIALITYHYSLVPTTFVIKLAVSRAGVPFPSVVEFLIILFFFEFAKEAGKRLPLVIGQALSIVSALILGDSAVKAGLASNATIVVVGIYAITSFINPRLSATFSIWSTIILIISASFGLHGFYIAFMLFIAHISSLKTCGYPYLFPIGTKEEFNYKYKDIITRTTLNKISNKILKKGKK